MAYHPWGGGGQLGGSCSPHLFLKTNCHHYATANDKILLTIQKYSPILIVEHLFAIVCHEGGRVF